MLADHPMHWAALLLLLLLLHTGYGVWGMGYVVAYEGIWGMRVWGRV